mgnify:CR=1 FL=1
MSLVYRFAFVKSLRMVLRMKVLQVGGGLGVVLPATQLLVPSSDALGAGTLAGLGVGVVAVASSCSWYCERPVPHLRPLGARRRPQRLVGRHQGRLERPRLPQLLQVRAGVPRHARAGDGGGGHDRARLDHCIAGDEQIHHIHIIISDELEHLFK